MSYLRDKFKKTTGKNSKVTIRYECENQDDIDVKSFNPRYVDWLERKLSDKSKVIVNRNIRHIIQEYHTFLKMKLSLDISDVWVEDYINETRECECESKLSDRSIRLKELYRQERCLGTFGEIDLLIQEYEKDIYALKSNIIDNLDAYDNGREDGNKAT